MQYFIKRGKKIQGPFGREKLIEFASAKKISGSDLVANDELGPFQSLSEVWPQIRAEADSGGDSAGSMGDAADRSTCANCNAPVFDNAMNCPKCGNLLKVSASPMGYADPQASLGTDPEQFVFPEPLPGAPVQPMEIPTQPTVQPFSPEQHPQPGQYPQMQPVPQQYIQPMAGPNYVQAVPQGAGVNHPVNKPAKKKRKAKATGESEINHRLIGIVCGGVGLIFMVVLFKIVLTPSLEGKADRLVKRLMTLGVQVQTLTLSNPSSSKLDSKLEELEKVGTELDEVLNQMTPEQKQRWEEKWIGKLIEKGLNF